MVPIESSKGFELSRLKVKFLFLNKNKKISISSFGLLLGWTF
jgi:hypothetical protein